MKKGLLLSLFLNFVLFVSAQQVLIEEFNGNFPPDGWSIDAHATNWGIEQSSYAGGFAPEVVFNWSPQFSDVTRLISPQLDLTGSNTLLLQFKHFIDHYDGSYQIGVATRSNGSDWVTSWSQTVTSSIPASTVIIPITGPNVNSSSFQFCIFFSGASYNINTWSIDDIILSIPGELDGSLIALDVPTYFTGTRDVMGTMANMGLTTITSFSINWQLDNGNINTDIITGQQIPMGSTNEFISTHPLTPEVGVHNLKVWISDVNAINTPDFNPADDTLIKVLRIPTQTVERLPMFEEFTSSTCSPCASFNNTVLNPFLSTNEEDLVYVKYQMDWPGNGDPYYTEEGGVRRAYYGVNGVPMLYVDGKNAATTSTGVNTAFANAQDTPAFIDLATYYTIDGNMVYVNGQFISYADMVDASMHIVVFERVTTGNVATNGETEFHHVMMKMLPDAYGTSISSISAQEPFTFSYSADMSGTNVEELSDLQVAIFIQDNVSKDIFQACYATLSGVGVSDGNMSDLKIYPNPVTDKINIILPENLTGKNIFQVFNNKGSMVEEIVIPSGSTSISVTNNLDSGIYTYRLTSRYSIYTGKIVSINNTF